MEFSIPNQLIEEIVKEFGDSRYQLFLVGGAVRDLLLEREVKDWDFTTDAKPEELLKLFPEGFYNNSFGTVGVNTSLGIVEITTMRKESGYGDSRHPEEVTWTDKIEEDLKRRDFTVNAMAMELATKNYFIIDPFGGKKDLQKKLISAVGDADARFQEDALRLMRAIRFATQLGFSVEENTFEAVKRNYQKILNISWERIRDEFFKILASGFPYEGMVMLRSSGLLSLILPEVDKSFGIIQEGPKHARIYDIGEHSLHALKFCSSSNPYVRFACLIHDVGKLPTYKKDSSGNATFYGHDVVGAKVAHSICSRFKLSRKDVEKVVHLVRHHLFTVDEKQTDSAIRRFIRNIGEENLDDMFILREADRLGGASNPSSWRTEHFKKRIQGLLTKTFSIKDLAVNGRDVMKVLNIAPSRKVGEILDKIFTEVEEDLSKNNREYLLERIRQLNQTSIS